MNICEYSGIIGKLFPGGTVADLSHAACYMTLTLCLFNNISISSAESQKGVNAVQQCSVENQKGATAIDYEHLLILIAPFWL